MYSTGNLLNSFFLLNTITDTDIREKKLACPFHKKMTWCFISKTFS